MPEILRRSLAPINDETWKIIDQEAARVLKANLSARHFVDLSGPHGWSFSSVNLGRLDIPKQNKGEDVPWGIREVLPLIEIRQPFNMEQSEVDYFSRGARDIDLTAIQDAAKKCAFFEETAIYKGFPKANIQGILEASSHLPFTLSGNTEECVKTLCETLEVFQELTIEGPFTLVLGSKPYSMLKQATLHGYPLQKAVQSLIGGEILWSPVLEGGVLVSTRGGDFELTVGKDFSIGYCYHDRSRIELYLTESFAFRVLEPNAIVVFEVQV
jgi:uncharacterized linocin/CFP29 family protein